MDSTEEIWHHGNMSREDAERALKDMAPNSWLIRFSEATGMNVISKKVPELNKGNARYSVDPTSEDAKEKFRYTHYKIRETADGFYFIMRTKKFCSIRQLVDYYKKFSAMPPENQAAVPQYRAEARSRSRSPRRPPFLAATLQVSQCLLSPPRSAEGSFLPMVAETSSLELSDDPSDNEEEESSHETEIDPDPDENRRVDEEIVVVCEDQGGCYYTTPNKPTLQRQRAELVESVRKEGEAAAVAAEGRESEEEERLEDEEDPKSDEVRHQESYGMVVRELQERHGLTPTAEKADPIRQLQIPTIETPEGNLVRSLREDFAEMQLEMETLRASLQRMEARFMKVSLAIMAHLQGNPVNGRRDLSDVIHKAETPTQECANSSPLAEHVTIRNRLDVIDSTVTPATSSKNSILPMPGTKLQAIAPYLPSFFDELELEIGCEVTFVAQVEPGWWRGRRGKKVGIFPSNFVQDVS